MLSKKTLIYILIIVCILLAFSLCNSCNKSKKIEDNETINEALKDSLSTYKNENGELVSRIKTISVNNISSFLDITSKEEEIKDLQELVKEYKKRLKDKGSAGIVNLEGSIDQSLKTEVTFDSLETKKELLKVYPTYTSEFNLDNWVWGKITASKDTTLVSLKYKEKVSFVIGKENTGFLGLKNEYFSDVKLENPYSKVNSFRTYNTKIHQPKFALTVGLAGTYSFGRQQFEAYPAVTLGYILWSK